jgi:hypothetical protein
MKYEIYCNQLTKRETKKDMRIHKYTIDKERDITIRKRIKSKNKHKLIKRVKGPQPNKNKKK